MQRHDELQRHQNVVILVQTDDLGGNALRHLRVLGGEQQHPRPAAAGLLGVGDGLFIDVFLGSQRNHRHTVRDQADGTVLQLPCCVGIRVHIADLLQLQAALQREGIVKPAPDEKAALGVHIAAGKVLDLLAVRKAGLDDLWRVQQPGGVILCLFLGQLPPRVGQTQGKQVQHAQLHHIGLGGRHRDLRPCVGVHDVIRCPGNAAAHHVYNGQHRHAPALGQLEGGQRIAGLARLADDDDQILRLQDGVAVAELAGDIHLCGHPRQRLNGGLAHHAGVHGRAAAHQMHCAYAAQLFIRQFRDAQLRQAILHPGADRCRDGGGLLVDLLEHKVGVAALFRGFHIPVCGQLFALHCLAELVIEADALCRAHGHVPFLQHAVAAGVLEQRRDIRGHKVFALAPAYDERAFPLDRKDGVRVVLEQHRQRIAAPHLGKRSLQSL